MKLRSIMRAPELRGKRVLLRFDGNVSEKELQEAKGGLRLARPLVTMNALLHRGAKLILMTHRGRPEGRRDLTHSTRPIAKLLTDLLGVPVKYVSDVAGAKARAAVGKLKPGEVLLLENLRYELGEEKNDPKFAKTLAALAELYVNDGFAVSHREHASVAGITKEIPSYAGLALMEEVERHVRVLEERPAALVIAIGGAKVETKAPILERFLRRGSRVLVGGALANVFFKAIGYEVGKSRCDLGEVKLAKELLKMGKIILPTDVVVAKAPTQSAPVRTIPPTAVQKDEMILDIGLETLGAYREIMRKARTIVWNGPMGLTEVPAFAHGSIGFARLLARISELGAYTLAGGGDTLPVLREAGVEASLGFVSTGGGAMLDMLSGTLLPGIAAVTQAE